MSTVDTQPVIAPLDLAAERAEVGSALGEAVQRVVASGQYVLGPEVASFEQEFARLHGCAHGVGMASGTDALVLGLLALGVKAGDHVLTTPFSFFATAGAIAWIGAVPRFCDVEADSALLDCNAVEAALTDKVTCILPVHLYGQLADMKRLRAIADERKLALLEDGAQAHMAVRDGIHCGELGDAGTFSFYPTKNLGAIGEGGIVLCQDEAVAQNLRQLRDHGSPGKYVHTRVGTNSRLHAIQAAALNVKLPHLAGWNDRRRRVAASYDEAFAPSASVRPLTSVDAQGHVYHQYTVRVQDRERVQKLCMEQGVATGVHYPQAIHLQEAAAEWGYGAGDFPNAEALANEVLCLPVHPFLKNGDVQRVIEVLLRVS